MKCQDVMKSPVKTCTGGTTISECAKLMRDFNVGIIPVVGARGEAIGIVTDRDITLKAVAEGKPMNAPVSDIMSTSLITCRPGDSLRDAEKQMERDRKSRVLVTNTDGTCAGIISLSDLSGVERNKRVGEVLSAITSREARA